MPDDLTIALSAACVAIAATGALTALVHPGQRQARVWLLLMLAGFAGLAGLPLISGLAPWAFPYILPLALPFLLGLSPVSYLYARARTGAAALTRQSLWHAVLPAAGWSLALLSLFLSGQQRDAMFVAGRLPDGALPAGLALGAFVMVMIWNAVSLGYLIAALRRLLAYRQDLKEFYSNTHGRELRWIDWFGLSLLGVWMVSALALLSDNIGLVQRVPDEAILAMMSVLLAVLAAFATLGESVGTQHLATLPSKPKYARSSVSADRLDRLAERIEAAMQRDQLFLDPDLSLEKLTRHLRATPNHVSQTLNQHLGLSFFDYVARWRITEAKARLAAGQTSVTAIAYEVGFNSRSTFYKAFRRETGLTPAQYRVAVDAESSES